VAHYTTGIWGCAKSELLSAQARILSAQPTRHRWAGKGLFAESHLRCSRHTCREATWLSAEKIFPNKKTPNGPGGPPASTAAPTNRPPPPPQLRCPHHPAAPPAPPSTTTAVRTPSPSLPRAHRRRHHFRAHTHHHLRRRRAHTTTTTATQNRERGGKKIQPYREEGEGCGRAGEEPPDLASTTGKVVSGGGEPPDPPRKVDCRGRRPQIGRHRASSSSQGGCSCRTRRRGGRLRLPDKETRRAATAESAATAPRPAAAPRHEVRGERRGKEGAARLSRRRGDEGGSAA
jgi:hypothetical protein